VTGLITTSGSQFQDWSATYRLFSEDRLPLPAMFSVVRRAVAAELPAGAPLRVVLDDTLLRRAGHKTPGVTWRRDPLGPRFQTNFVRGQRFLQFSAAMPIQEGYRMTPIALLHTPTPQKPSRKASPEELAKYRKDVRDSRIALRASQQIAQLRKDLDGDEGGKQRTLLLAFDGGYTNSTPPVSAAFAKMPNSALLRIRLGQKPPGAVFVTAFPPPLPNSFAPTIPNHGSSFPLSTPARNIDFALSACGTSCGARPALPSFCNSS